ncbi:MAG TPA: pseudouridine-5'-phosphate glycosidase [Chloroflexota bacterium]
MSESAPPGLPPSFRLSDEVGLALREGRPVVALESAVFTHGLPEPYNVQIIHSMAQVVRELGAVPAGCLVDDGWVWVGADTVLAESVARNPERQKASVRDLGSAIASCVPAGLTVSATLFVAHRAGIRVFATGGIGGVHAPATTGDISADLLQLSRSPVVTICSGAKSVLDIPRTLEALETLGVPVFSYQTPEFPSFYLERTGVSAPMISSAAEIARVAKAQWDLGYKSGIVIGNPIPAGDAIEQQDWKVWLESARTDAAREGIQGKAVTPYLLDRVAAASAGRTVRANVALLESNARLAAEVAAALLP